MKVGHVGINVNNMEKSKEFYLKLFGFEVIFEETQKDKRYIFLGHSGEIIITLWEQSNKRFSKDTAGLHHLAFILDSVDELKAFEKKLEDNKDISYKTTGEGLNKVSNIIFSSRKSIYIYR